MCVRRIVVENEIDTKTDSCYLGCDQILVKHLPLQLRIPVSGKMKKDQKATH
jgi:hypothetical protein